MRLLPLVLVACLPLAARSAEPGERLSPDQFEALVTGKTFVYRSEGKPYGVEQYLPDHHVIWAFLGEECRRGRWYEERGDICFVYEDNPDPQCWSFWQIGVELRAKFRGDPEGVPLVAVGASPEPMACPGPDVGV